MAFDRNRPKRAASSESSYSLMEFTNDFPDDDACLDWLWRARYSPDGDHATCPKCQVVRTFKRYPTKQRRQTWTCTTCGQHVQPTAGTIFHKSSTPLQLWFYAMYLMTSTRCGISAKQLERELGVTYKTAWRMFHLIRHELMDQDPDDEPLSGEVEMDETYVGGRPRLGQVRNKQEAREWAERKAKVFGMVERKGKVSAHVVPSRKGPTLMRYVEGRVLPRTLVYTDEAPVYRKNLPKRGYQHQRVHHAQRVYVDGNVHTNTIEGFWSLVKRGISGTHHAVSAKFLQGYLNEYVWRYNRRNDGRAMFWSLLLRAGAPS